MGMQQVRRLCTSSGQWLLCCLCSFQEGSLNEGQQDRVFLRPWHLWHIKHGSTPKPWLSKGFSDNPQLVQSAATATNIYYSFIFPQAAVAPLYLLWTTLQSEEQKSHFMKAERGCFSGNASAEGVLRKIQKKGKSYTCIQSPRFAYTG